MTLPIEPYFHLSVEIARRWEGHVFAILRPHGRGLLDGHATFFGQFQLGHRIEQFGQMTHDALGFVAIGQNVQQIRRRDEIESKCKVSALLDQAVTALPGKGQSFRFEIVRESLFAE